MKVEELYQEIILDHYRAKHHSGLREPYDAEVHHVNPTCGDEVTLRVHLDGDTVSDVSYEGLGCSISQASTSVMTDLVIGHDVADGLDLHEEFLTMMQGKGRSSRTRTGSRTAIAFAGVAGSRPGSSARCSAGRRSRTPPAGPGATRQRGETATRSRPTPRPSDLVRDDLPDVDWPTSTRRRAWRTSRRR